MYARRWHPTRCSDSNYGNCEPKNLSLEWFSDQAGIVHRPPTSPEPSVCTTCSCLTIRRSNRASARYCVDCHAPLLCIHPNRCNARHPSSASPNVHHKQACQATDRQVVHKRRDHHRRRTIESRLVSEVILSNRTSRDAKTYTCPQAEEARGSSLDGRVPEFRRWYPSIVTTRERSLLLRERARGERPNVRQGSR